jgi:hypothetical protein
MIKINIKNLELPVFDIVQATPIHIPLKKDFNLYFKIPTVNEYFKFESKYLGLLQKYFLLLSGVNFLELDEFKDSSLKQEFLKKLKIALQNEKFKKDFKKILIEYFEADFEIDKILDIINPFEMGYLFMFIHNIIENVKSFFFTGSKKARGQDQEDVIGNLFYLFERYFHKNRTQILRMPITYAILLQRKYNQEQLRREKDHSGKRSPGKKPNLNINQKKRKRS